MRANYWCAAIAACVIGLSADLYAKTADTVEGLDGALIVVLSNGEKETGKVAAKLGASGNSLIHVIASDVADAARVNADVAKAGLKGIVSVETLDVKNSHTVIIWLTAWLLWIRLKQRMPDLRLQKPNAV